MADRGGTAAGTRIDIQRDEHQQGILCGFLQSHCVPPGETLVKDHKLWTKSQLYAGSKIPFQRIHYECVCVMCLRVFCIVDPRGATLSNDIVRGVPASPSCTT